MQESTLKTIDGKLSFREKFFYGIGDGGFNALFAAISFYFSYFLINVGGVKPKLASIILIIGKVWDALVCFVMGFISDKTENKRFGNRRAYLLFDSLPFGASFILIWLSIKNDSQALRVIYHLFAFMIFQTLYDIGYIPYNAISASMTPNYDERTSLNGYRIVLANLGILIGAAVFAVLADGKESVFYGVFGELQKGYIISGAIYSVIGAVILFLCGLNVKERIDAREKLSKPWYKGVSDLFHLPEFRSVAAWYCISLGGFDIILNVYMFYINDALDFGGGIMAMVLVAIPLIAAIGSAAGWVYFSEKYSKESIYVISAIWLCIGLFISIAIPKKCLWGIILDATFVGIGMSAIQILPYAAVPDVCDIDEFVNGERKEGIMYGLLQFGYKVISGIVTSLSTAIIGFFGYVESTDGSKIDQSEKALKGVRGVFGIGPTIFFLIAIIPSIKSKISRERINSIKVELDNRKKSVSLNKESSCEFQMSNE